ECALEAISRSRGSGHQLHGADLGPRRPALHDAAATGIGRRRSLLMVRLTGVARQTGVGVLMSIRIVQLGTRRKSGEGLRIGTVRRPPRGVPKSDFARLDYYDVWFPNLSPSAELVHKALAAADERAWAAFTRKFRREMSAPDRSRELDLLAALSHHTNL